MAVLYGRRMNKREIDRRTGSLLQFEVMQADGPGGSIRVEQLEDRPDGIDADPAQDEVGLGLLC